jgi:hypothetical protein
MSNLITILTFPSSPPHSNTPDNYSYNPAHNPRTTSLPQLQKHNSRCASTNLAPTKTPTTPRQHPASAAAVAAKAPRSASSSRRGRCRCCGNWQRGVRQSRNVGQLDQTLDAATTESKTTPMFDGMEWNGTSILQFRTRPIRLRLVSSRRRRDVCADLNGARPLVCVVDFERMPCSSWDADWLRVRSRDHGIFAFEGEDVASGSVFALEIMGAGLICCVRSLDRFDDGGHRYKDMIRTPLERENTHPDTNALRND